MGLLGENWDDPQSNAIMQLAGGLLSGNFGQGAAAYGATMAGAKDTAMKRQFMQSQMDNYKSEITQRDVATQKSAYIQDMMKTMFPLGMDAPAVSPGAFAPAADGRGPTMPPSMQSLAQPGSSLANLSIDKIAGLKAAGGPDLMDAYKWVKDPLKLEQGSTYQDRATGEQRYMPKVGEGIAPDKFGFYNALPGYGAAQAGIEGQKAGAVASAQANSKPIKVYNPATGRDEWTSEGSVVGGQQPGRTGNPMIDAVAQTESGGNPNAVSPKGARGVMQVMPGTSRAPGFGVTPARDNSEAELTRVGQDYLGAMQARYKDPALAAIAYNWGAGNTDLWLKSGGDFNKLPAETKSYVAQVLTRNGVNGQGGGRAPQSGNFAAGPSADESAAAKANETRQVNTAAADVVRDTSKQKDGKLYGQLTAGLDRAIGLLGQGPTASGAGAWADSAANFLGKSTKGADVASQLDTVSGWLTANVPRMEGPQSDKDVQSYRIMAAEVGDRTKPISQRLAAAKELQGLQAKYAELNGGAANTGGAGGQWGDKPVLAANKRPPPQAMKGMVRGGYKFKGGNPSDQANWEKM